MNKTTIAMSDRELERIPILERLKNGEITQNYAGGLLGLGRKQVGRILKKYKEKGVEGLVHGLRGEDSNNKKVDDPRIIDIIRNPDFHDCKPIFVTKKIKDYYGIKASKETIRHMMVEQGIWHIKERNIQKYRALRPRRDSYGEMLQFDGSYHLWFEDRNDEWCLLVAQDDATGNINWAKFVENESYENVVNFWIEYMERHGIPKEIYLDKFSTYKVNHKKATYEKELKTQFDTAMKQLGCHLIFANSPQAKGRVEKCNYTLQDWLVKEMRLLKISTPEDGNKYLQETFIQWFNTTYSVPAKTNYDLHKPLNNEQKNNFERIFARKYERSLGRDYILQYKNQYFQVEEPKNKEYVVYPKKKLLFEETIAGEIRIFSGKCLVNYHKLDKDIVERNRAKYRFNKHQAQRKIEKARFEERKKEKHKTSKQKQQQYKAQKLFEIIKQKKS